MKKLKKKILETRSHLKTAAMRLNYNFAFTRRDRRVIRMLAAVLSCVIGLRARAVIQPAREWFPTPQEKTLVAQIASDSTARAQTRPGSHPQNKSNYTPPAYMQKKKFTVELNRADTFDLQEVYGVGPARARLIVQHREKLGGFTHLEQLREVWGIDSAVYEKMLQSVYLASHPQVRRININTADIKTLKNHPYLDYYQAKEIFLYRRDHGPYKSVSEIRAVNLIDAATYRRIAPYLTVENTMQPDKDSGQENRGE